MTQKVDVRALANLARLEVSDEELARLEKEIPAILGFVETIQAVSGAAGEVAPEVRNVMREDVNPHESGIHTEELLSAAPSRKGDLVAVKQVLSRKK
ncbi:aspartyl/glutamyl-tRNA amidotransferase subunit C [Candidatus Kaiserbacteria bacterium]|nr:aspartyl/glutamyl-tRNA amidotransferase subunit C [Candidatus Kaiserbacteria bacterium]